VQNQIKPYEEYNHQTLKFFLSHLPTSEKKNWHSMNEVEYRNI